MNENQYDGTSYGMDTFLAAEEYAYPRGGQTRPCRALWPDGVVRRVWGGIPDTYFSIPAHGVRNDQHFSGYLTLDEVDGEQTLVFHPRCKPVRYDSRVSYGIEWYAREGEAELISEIVSRSETINGGFRHGEPCGRAPEFDSNGQFAVIRS